MSENMKLRTGPIAIFLSAAIILSLALSILIGPVPLSFQSLFSLFCAKISGTPVPAVLSKVDTIGSAYLSMFPGIAIVVTIIALNFLGDGLRDAMDPKLKR